MPSSKIAQVVSPELLVQIQNNSTELFLLIPSTKIAQMVPLCWIKGPPELQIRNIFNKTSPPEPLIQIQNNFTELSLLIPSTKLAQIYLKPKVTLHCYNIYLFWIFVSGILNVFDSY